EVEAGANFRNSFTQAPRSQSGAQVCPTAQLARRHEMKAAGSKRLDKILHRAGIQKGSRQSTVVLDAEVLMQRGVGKIRIHKADGLLCVTRKQLRNLRRDPVVLFVLFNRTKHYCPRCGGTSA